MTNLLHRNNKSVTIHNKFSKIPPSTFTHFSTLVRVRVLFVWVDLHVFLCRQQHPKCKLEICLLYPNLFYILYPSSNPTNKNVTDSNAKFKQLYLWKHSKLDTRSYELFSHSDQYCHLQKYWPFFLNHPVYSQVQRSTLPAKDQFVWALTSLTAVFYIKS